MNSVIRSIAQILAAFKTLSSAKRTSIIIVAVASLLSIATFVYFVNQVEYRVLFSNLSTEDAGEIIAELQKKKISYKVSSAGTSILVPSGDVSELRLELAASGLPQCGVVGFELFDNNNYGVTDFVQQLNYQRALQGELSRTINKLEEIQQSRVHIVMPKKSLFVEEQKKPTASVIIKLKSGRKISESQVEGIAHLVASSVEGLLPEEVMVIDSRGNMLIKKQARSQLSDMSNSQIEYQRNIEKELVTRVQTMLENVVGKGNVVARVSTNLDFRVMERTEETFDSEEPVVRSVHRKFEKSSKPVGGGESTVSPTRKQTTTKYGTSHEKTDEILNYEISKIISKTVMPVGGIKQISAAVLVEGTYLKNDQGIEEFQPRSKKEIAALEELVKKTVGFNARRGDQVVVNCIPFKKVELDKGFADGESWQERLIFFAPIIKYMVILIGVSLIVLFILRPIVNVVLTKQADEEVIIRELPSGADNQLEEGKTPLKLETSSEDGKLKELQVVKELASRDAQQFAALLRNWLN